MNLFIMILIFCILFLWAISGIWMYLDLEHQRFTFNHEEHGVKYALHHEPKPFVVVLLILVAAAAGPFDVHRSSRT